MKWCASWGSNGSAQMLRESQTEGCFSIMNSEVERAWGGRDRSGKVLGTESEWQNVSSGFHLFPFIRWPWQKCQSVPCPRPQIKKPRNKGTRARNTTVWKSMTDQGAWDHDCKSLQRLQFTAVYTIYYCEFHVFPILLYPHWQSVSF